MPRNKDNQDVVKEVVVEAESQTSPEQKAAEVAADVAVKKKKEDEIKTATETLAEIRQIGFEKLTREQILSFGVLHLPLNLLTEAEKKVVREFKSDNRTKVSGSRIHWGQRWAVYKLSDNSYRKELMNEDEE